MFLYQNLLFIPLHYVTQVNNNVLSIVSLSNDPEAIRERDLSYTFLLLKIGTQAMFFLSSTSVIRNLSSLGW